MHCTFHCVFSLSNFHVSFYQSISKANGVTQWTRGIYKTSDACNLLKKRLWYRYFPVNFAKCCEIDKHTLKILLYEQRKIFKVCFYNILQNSQESTCARVSFLIKLQALDAISTSYIRLI